VKYISPIGEKMREGRKRGGGERGSLGQRSRGVPPASYEDQREMPLGSFPEKRNRALTVGGKKKMNDWSSDGKEKPHRKKRSERFRSYSASEGKTGKAFLGLLPVHKEEGGQGELSLQEELNQGGRVRERAVPL